MKKFFMIFTLVAAMLLSAATALAAVPSIMDNAKLLSNGDKAKVERVLQQVENKYNVRVGVVTVKSIGTKKPGDFANELIDKAYNNGPNGNMVLLLDSKKVKQLIHFYITDILLFLLVMVDYVNVFVIWLVNLIQLKKAKSSLLK